MRAEVLLKVGRYCQQVSKENRNTFHLLCSDIHRHGNNLCYYTLNSLSLSWFTESVRWIFEVSTRDVTTADYKVIMSRTHKVTGNHVKYDRGAWFLRVIMSSSRTLSCLRSLKEQKKTNFFRSMYNKTIIGRGFCDIQNNRGLGKGYQPKPKAEADNPCRDLDYSGYHKNLIQ